MVVRAWDNAQVENDRYGPDSAIQNLVAGLNAVAGAGTYAFRSVSAPPFPLPRASPPSFKPDRCHRHISLAHQAASLA